MPLDNVSFVELVALTRITPESTTEKFGGLINSSFFDASNILGTLKQRGLIDFVTSFPSQSAISVTDEGKKLLAEANEKAAVQFDQLDMAILIQLSNGNRNLQDITSGVNVTPKDLAIHLYRLSQQQFVSYELRNGNMSINLTEKGFLRVKEGIPREGATQAQATPTASPMTDMDRSMEPKPESMMTETGGSIDATAQLSQPEQKVAKTPEELHALETKIIGDKKMKGILVVVVILIIVILAVLYMLSIHAI